MINFITDIMINTLKKTASIIALVVMSITTMYAQEDPVVLKAMKDELKRNMEELKLEGFERPFFISYTINDAREVAVNASLGAIMRSSEFPGRTKNVRVMVGDYAFNDESLDLNGGNGEQGNEINMPIDDDYFGIRRSLWATTDAIYRSATKTFKDNVNFLKEQKKELKDIPHRSFAKAPVIKRNGSGQLSPCDRKKLEDLCRELSIIFKNYGDITNSNVIVHVNHTNYYFVNSEGTVIATSDNIASITINAQTKTAEGEFIFDHITHTALSTDKLPPLSTLRDETKQLAERLTSLRSIPVFKESYTGPVLFIGPAAVDVFSTSLFSLGENLTASKNITNSFSTTDAKIGKKILDDRFTVKSTPKLKTFNDIELLGSYEVDDEGVIPADELILIEGGILKNLLTDRTITKEGQTSNGHGSGPGVIAVTSNGGVPVDKLKAQLIEKAKEEGLEYAIIVRHFSAGGVRSMNTYKVSLTDGKEELVRSATVRSVNMKALKKVMGVSNAQIARNTEAGRFGGSISMIAPDALLLEEVEVEGSRSNPFLDREVYVENPVKGTKKE